MDKSTEIHTTAGGLSSVDADAVVKDELKRIMAAVPSLPVGEGGELATCPWCPTERREIVREPDGRVLGVIFHEEGCFLAPIERRQILTAKGIAAWNTRRTLAPVGQAPTDEEADAYLRGQEIIKKCEICGQDATLINEFVAHLAKRYEAQSQELTECQKLVELARDHVWEPENWESYERCKGTSSFSLPVEWFELCEAIEEKYGAMPLDEPCECGAKTIADHAPDCDEKPTWKGEEHEVDCRAVRADAVIEAAIAWHQSGQEGDNTWADKGEVLGQAIDSLLKLQAKEQK